MRTWHGLIPEAPPQATLTAWVGTTGETPTLPLELQRFEDAQQQAGAAPLLEGHFLRELDDDGIDAFLHRGGGDGDPALLPSGSLQSHGGAVAEVGDAETALATGTR